MYAIVLIPMGVGPFCTPITSSTTFNQDISKQKKKQQPDDKKPHRSTPKASCLGSKKPVFVSIMYNAM